MLRADGWRRRHVRGALILAVSVECAGGVACSLIASFDDRPSRDVRDAGPGADVVEDAREEEEGGENEASAPEYVAAFPLEACDAEAASSPVDPQACNYRDESCSGFADLRATYAQKAAAAVIDATLSCERGALVAYEWTGSSAGGGAGASPELRVLARERSGAAGCAGGGAAEALVLLRLDAETLALRERVAVTLRDGDGRPADAPGLVLGRSERRLIVAYAGERDDGKRRLFVLSTPIDRAPADAEPVSGEWELRRAAELPAGAGFVPGSLTASDDAVAGRFFVAVDPAAGELNPLLTLADEAATTVTPYGPVLRFADGSVSAVSRAALFPRTTFDPDMSGSPATAARIGPAAVASRSDVAKTIGSFEVGPEWLTGLHYLLAPTIGTTGLATPWFAAAPLVPEHPGPAFGTQPRFTRLEIFSFGGRSYAQLRGCAMDKIAPCTTPADPGGGNASIEVGDYPPCSGEVPLAGAMPNDPDGSGNAPRLYATCDLGKPRIASGVVTWHRVAGGFGAAIANDGATLWIVRPGGVAVAGGAATIGLATPIALPAGGELAASGPLGATFVDGLGWIVTAVEQATGHLWARRFGCADLP